MAIRTIAICDKCGRRETFERGRTNSEIVDTMITYDGWTSLNEYEGNLLCMKCSEEGEEDEETPNES